MAESHLVTVAQQAQHGQCYWEYIYIWELELHLGISSTLKNMTYTSGNTPYILRNTPYISGNTTYISGNTTYVSGNKRMTLMPKGAPAWKSRTHTRLVSPAAG
jgi:hypothetical protein